MRHKMKFLSIWTAVVLTATSALASASTFQNPEIDELYTQENQPELYCLAQNVYFEAKSEPLAGQYAVADVVLNRVQDTRYPNTICEVVREGPIKESWKTKQDPNLSDDERIYYPKKNRCQFSWYCDGKPDDPVGENWEISLNIAIDMLEERRNNLGVDITDGALYYHANYVKPYWAKTMHVVARIGDHIFYR